MVIFPIRIEYTRADTTKTGGLIVCLCVALYSDELFFLFLCVRCDLIDVMGMMWYVKFDIQNCIQIAE